MRKVTTFLMVLGLVASWGAVATADSLAERRIREKLKSVRVSMDFTDAPIKDVANFLQAVGGINLLLDPQLFRDRSEEEFKVSLTVKDIRLEHALNLLCGFFKLHQEIRQGVLILTSEDRASQAVYLKVYDVRDLMLTIRDFKGPNIKLQAADQGSGTSGILFTESDEGGKSIVGDKDALLELIRDNTGAEAWESHPKAGLSVIAGRVVVTHTKEMQRRVYRLLMMLRTYR